jgi:hypothetical protein
MKTCTKCKKSLSLLEFHKHKLSADGLNPSCKHCEKLRKATYYTNNIEDFKTYSKLYTNLNKDKVNSRNRRWRNENIDKVREQLRNRKKLERQDSNKRLANTLRNRLSSALKGRTKMCGLAEYLGCSIDELKKHLESKFQPGMTWDNYGFRGWHIDHIIPLSKVDISTIQGIKEACNYNNLQPLWWRDNIVKGNKYVRSST